MLERQSAIQGALRLHPPGMLGVGDGQAPGVRLTEHRLESLIQVTAFAPCVAQAASMLTDLIGVSLPADNRFTVNASVSVRNVAPGTWLVCAGPGALHDPDALRMKLRGVATVVDLTHARTAFRISGLASVKTLIKFCSIDLAGTAFPSGSATNTRFGHVGMTLARLDDDPTFEILVYRGYAVHVFELLLESAAEFGVELVA